MKFCFDCDDTLYDLQDPFRKCVAQFFPNYAGDLEEFYRIYREYAWILLSSPSLLEP